jgi:hypothetical protein
MDLGWKRLIPLSLAWLLMVAGYVVEGWWGVGLSAVVLVCAVLITRAFTVGAEREESRALLSPLGARADWPADRVTGDRSGMTSLATGPVGGMRTPASRSTSEAPITGDRGGD